MTPPVVFSPDASIPAGDYEPLRVFHFDGIAGPRGDTTLRWLDEVSPFLPPKVLLIWDQLRGHRGRAVTEALEELNIEAIELPVASHALLNPCDNSLNAWIKQKYYKEDRSTHQSMLMSLKNVYSSLPDEMIVNYFEHTGITSDDDMDAHAEHLVNEGYHADEEREEHLESMREAYRQWKHNLRSLGDDVHLPQVE
jgi:hypothetical protein